MSDPYVRWRTPRHLCAPRTLAHIVRILNFFGYDGITDGPPVVGPRASLSPTMSVRNGQRVTIGAGAHVGQWTCLWAGNQHGRIIIGEHALLAPHVFVTASDYDFDAGDGPVMNLPKREADVRIGANTWLGANVVVVAGVTIGDGAIVAAGAVVTHDVAPGMVVAGSPARVIRARGHAAAPRSVAG